MMTILPTSNFGLTERDLNCIFQIFKQHPQIEEAWIFGSRAKGNFKPGSDIDIALMGNELTSKELRTISEELSESALPYFVDVVGLSELKNKSLEEHIHRVGKVFFRKEL